MNQKQLESYLLNVDNWKVAFDDEYASFLKNETWQLDDLPQNKTLVNCKWIFQKKNNSSDSILK
jgi:hypothetical protein